MKVFRLQDVLECDGPKECLTTTKIDHSRLQFHNCSVDWPKQTMIQINRTSGWTGSCFESLASFIKKRNASFCKNIERIRNQKWNHSPKSGERTVRSIWASGSICAILGLYNDTCTSLSLSLIYTCACHPCAGWSCYVSQPALRILRIMDRYF